MIWNLYKRIGRPFNVRPVNSLIWYPLRYRSIFFYFPKLQNVCKPTLSKPNGRLLRRYLLPRSGRYTCRVLYPLYFSVNFNYPESILTLSLERCIFFLMIFKLVFKKYLYIFFPNHIFSFRIHLTTGLTLWHERLLVQLLPFTTSVPFCSHYVFLNRVTIKFYCLIRLLNECPVLLNFPITGLVHERYVFLTYPFRSPWLYYKWNLILPFLYLYGHKWWSHLW